MAYIGTAPAEAYTATAVKDSFNGDGSTVAFTMSQPSKTNDVRVVVENVIQDPTVAYSCSGTTITFTSAPPSGTANVYVVHLGLPVQSIVPPADINIATTYTTDLTVQGGLTVDTNTLFVDSANNRVGVGTASPSSLLHVSSSDGDIVKISGSTKSLYFRPDTAGCMIATSTGQLGTGIYWNDTSNYLYFQTNSTEAARFDSNGNLILKKNLVLESTSEGVDFSGVGSSAQTLDSYEEGSFTPTLITTGTFPTVTHIQQLGHYTKIGRSVTVSLLIQINGYTGSPTGNASIAGLPFAVSNTNSAMYSQWLTTDKRDVTVTSGYVFRGGYFWRGNSKMTLMQSQISGTSAS
ncbi:MAG: hypothetical protein VW518_06310 [Burkholderiaceae bacterium]